MGNQELSVEVYSALKKFIREEKYGGCIMFEIFKNGDIAILWHHWKYSPAFKAPRVFIGGKFRNQKPIIKYLWLNTK